MTPYIYLASASMLVTIGQIGWIGCWTMFCQFAIQAEQSQSRQQPQETKQLPSESAIPGERPIGAQLMPSESSIPGQPAANRNLPSELTLPPYSAQQPMNANENGDVVNADHNDQDAIKEFSQRPILRIRGDGPVGDLKSICFSTDAKRIFAGGFDKSLHVWQQLQRDQAPAEWVYEKSVDWQINRGNQGQIFSIAAGEKNLVFGGVGASASNGEIAMLESGQIEFGLALTDVQRGHRDSIFALATDTQSRIVASIDVVGRTILWRRDLETGKWSLEPLREADSDVLGKPTATELAPWRSYGGAISVSDSRSIFYPEVTLPVQARTAPSFHLMRMAADGSKTQLAAPEPHQGAVVAIACSRDGQRIVSADLRNSGRLFLWDLTTSPTAKVVKTDWPIRCVALSPDGTRLMFGTARNAGGRAATRVWSWAANQTLTELANWEGNDDVQSCAFSPLGTQLAFTRGAKIIVCDLATRRQLQTLESKMEQPTKVAFSSADGDYRCLLQDASSDNIRWSFDPAKLNLIQLADNAANDWVAPNPATKNWKIVSSVDDQTTLRRYSVEVNGKHLCQIPVPFQRVGAPTSTAFVTDSKNPNSPAGLIVGTSGKNHVYVFRIGEDRCELVREYRGHAAAVNSVGISADKKYLVSAAQDGTACFWKLSAALDDPNWQQPNQRWLNRWGAEFAVAENRLVVTNLIEDGPLYFRGVRKNDVIEKIIWTDQAGTQQELADPTAIRNQLGAATSDRLTRFEYRRGVVEQPYFYLYPAWQPLASFAWDRQREWAFWTPYGFYDASFNGHKFFGWQINQGVDRPVKFFRAAELKEELERPKMMQKLLSAGSVERAFLTARMAVPQNLSDRLNAISRLKPTIKLLPVVASLRAGHVKMTAEVSLPAGVELASVKAFANGVPAIKQNSALPMAVKRPNNNPNQTFQFLFEFDLPRDRRVKLQVLAASRLGHGAMAETTIDGPSGTATQPPKFFVMSLGVSKYQDSQIPQLDFADLNARKIFKQFTSVHSTDQPSVLLTDDSASRSMWMITSRTLADEMKRTARADDLLVVFLSGHGFRDPINETYFFLTANSKYSDVLSRRYSDCISFEELSAFGEIGCRKLVILDTCHSGTLQALSQEKLKSIVRTLENDLFFTLTASEGSQVAFESTQRGLGLFTARLTDALNGQSDLLAAGGNGDGHVTLQETVNFLKTTVPSDAARMGGYQYPTASPVDLLELAEIRLSEIRLSEIQPER